MKRFYSSINILIFAVIIVGISIFVYFVRNVSDPPIDSSSLQCTHWSVFRICQLMGVPIDRDYLVEKLPFQSQGHSMMQMAEVLHEIGFQTEGRKENIESLETGSFPCIVHLIHPGHYIVISGIDDKYVHVFDGNGRRTAREKSQFEKDWSGNVLWVKKTSDHTRLPAFLPKPSSSAPLASFDSLICDLGTVPTTGEPVAFQYTLRNVGDADMIIEDIRPDCSCIISTKPDKPIKSGEQGIIELHYYDYYVQPQKGPFSHGIIVKTNDPIIPQVALTVSGWSGVGIKIEPGSIHLPDMVKNHEIKFDCFVKYSGEKQALLLEIDNTIIENVNLVCYELKPIGDAIAKNRFPEILTKTGKFDDVYLLELTFSPEGEIADNIEGYIDIKTNIVGYEKIKLNVFGKIVPPIRAFPEILILDDANKTEVTLVSQFAEPFKINRIIFGADSISWNDTSNSTSEKTINFSLNKPNDENLFDQQTLLMQFEFLESKTAFELPFKVIY